MVIAVLIAYLCVLVLVSKRMGGNDSDADFFLGNRRSPWWAVAIGMVGASVSGVSFVSVPGWVPATSFTYMQMVLGFLLGYVVVAYVLLPIYYKSGKVSIYSVLSARLGGVGRLTGAIFFLVNKLLGASVKFYVAAFVLFQMADLQWLPYPFFVVLCLLFVYLYTYKSGIKAVVWTDLLQTLVMVLTLVLLLRAVLAAMGMDFVEGIRFVRESSYSQIFQWEDWSSRNYFWKQFVSGAFVVVVMTGLDQDMIQKNLSCRSLREAQRNMMSYAFIFIPVNLLFLMLGLLIASHYGMDTLPAVGDGLLPYFVKESGALAMVCFSVGMLASSLSSVDSAMTAMTTSFLNDVLRREGACDASFRHKIHLGVAACVGVLVVLLDFMRNNHAIDLIYQLVSYLYGPLLGMFAFCLFHKKARLESRWVAVVALLSPILSYWVSIKIRTAFSYEMGYELLLLNGLLTYVGILLVSLISGRKI